VAAHRSTNPAATREITTQAGKRITAVTLRAVVLQLAAMLTSRATAARLLVQAEARERAGVPAAWQAAVPVPARGATVAAPEWEWPGAVGTRVFATRPLLKFVRAVR